MKVNVLGTAYTIEFKSKSDDKLLEECDGYCDSSSKRIVVVTNNGNLDDFLSYQRQCLRHELVHAFLNESGLQNNWENSKYGQEETLVGWIAIQFPKMLEVFIQAECL